jgi:Ca2+-binding RTX toxin-like protein
LHVVERVADHRALGRRNPRLGDGGGDGNDFITGGAGKDTLFGGRGEDTLDGGLGNDYLNPGPDADRVIGGFENDQIFSLDGSPDTIYGDDGFDRVKTDADDLLLATEGPLA